MMITSVQLNMNMNDDNDNIWKQTNKRKNI